MAVKVTPEKRELHKMDISYFSGKLEAYLRYKEIPHHIIECETLGALHEVGFYFGHRQLREWLWNDGVNKYNSDDVCDMLFREPLLEQQLFLLGSHPSIADFGYFGSFFHHFSNDPISAEVMRRYGLNTYESVIRLCNTKQNKLNQEIIWQWSSVPYWQPWLERIIFDYLLYLHQNVVAFRDDKKQFDYQGRHFRFNRTVTTHYWEWCRQELHKEFSLLSLVDTERVDELFSAFGSLSSLHHDGVIDLGLSEQSQLPIDPKYLKRKPNFSAGYYGQPRN